MAHLRLTAIFVAACCFGLKLFGASWGLQLLRTLRISRRAPARFALHCVLRLAFALRLASAELRLCVACSGSLPQRYGYALFIVVKASCERDSRGARAPFEHLRGMEAWEKRQESHDDGQ